jgi:hypothetical protein
MGTHVQTWIKVNAPVDTGIAEMVSILNNVSDLETLQSCQGDPGGREAYVYFSCGNWSRLCELVFVRIGPVLKSRVDEDARLVVEATSAESPMAKLSFRAEAAETVASALKDALNHDAP